MYKSRLQELCQQKFWRLPVYSSMKDGPDHNPSFKASVDVNGVSFDSPNFCKSSKEAQNGAAKFAFDHFTSLNPLSLQSPVGNDSSPSLPGSSSARTELNNTPSGEGILLQKNQETSQSSQIHENALSLNDDKEFGDMQSLHKNQLQIYAQRKNLNLPLYSCVREGPPHALRFKAKVTVDGHTFENPEFFRTLKEAEHAAAKAALMSLSQDGIQEDDSGIYKNLLQELTRKEGFSLPIYKTIGSGASHLPTFLSSVEIEGAIFHGIAANTKKQAEMNAAKVAYSRLKERRLSRSSSSLIQNCQAQEALQCTSSSSHSSVTVDLEQNVRALLISTPSIGSEKHGEESRAGDQESDFGEITAGNDDVRAHHSIPSPSKSGTNTPPRNRDSSSSSDMIYARLRDPFPSVPSSPEDGPSSPTTVSDCSDPSVTNTELPLGMRSSLLCNRVRVYPCRPSMKFPDDVTLLPISDDKWVAVRLDFSNQEGN